MNFNIESFKNNIELFEYAVFLLILDRDADPSFESYKIL
jgi:hypothetical protein